MEHCAGPCWGTGSSSEKKREKGRTQSECSCFFWNCPLRATRGQPHQEAVWPVNGHTLQLAHVRPLSTFRIKQSHYCDLKSGLSSPALWVCQKGRGLQHPPPPLAAYWGCLLCLFFVQSRAAAFSGDCLFSLCSRRTVYKYKVLRHRKFCLLDKVTEWLGGRRMPAQRDNYVFCSHRHLTIFQGVVVS